MRIVKFSVDVRERLDLYDAVYCLLAYCRVVQLRRRLQDGPAASFLLKGLTSSRHEFEMGLLFFAYLEGFCKEDRY